MENESFEMGRVAGIILAAGVASRMGQPKQLLPWKGEALIRHAVHAALTAFLSPVVVVTGARAEQIAEAVSDLNVKIIYNPAWADGQSTSVRAGISSLPGDVQAALFLLADQPYVSAELIRALKEAYFAGRPPVLATYVAEKRTNPVLFDRSTFADLCQLQGDAGARSIFSKLPPVPFQWADERLLFDVDTPEDYQKLLNG